MKDELNAFEESIEYAEIVIAIICIGLFFVASSDIAIFADRYFSMRAMASQLSLNFLGLL